MTQRSWTAAELRAAMERDLALCRTDHERLMCRVICEKEIREMEGKA